MGKQKRRDAAAVAPPSPTKAESAPGSPAKSAAQPAAGRQQQPPVPQKPQSLRERFLPDGFVLPWWVVLVFSVYCLLKLGLTLEHPCGVLGVHAPVTRSQIQKAYRSLSACTHPDKLLGFEAEDIQRGELLFKRASSAREQLLKEVKDASASPQCTAAKQREAAIRESLGPDDPVPEASAADEAACAATCSTQLDDLIMQARASRHPLTSLSLPHLAPRLTPSPRATPHLASSCRASTGCLRILWTRAASPSSRASSPSSTILSPSSTTSR